MSAACVVYSVHVDVTAALHEEELDGDLEALDLVEYAQVARIKYDLDNNKSNKKFSL